ncbi:MFS transporter [Nocardia macrotermitis]|uniref:Multidrug resistance protein MdtL n=1 Tax=Nocardia macrotermitis TaxID=2585198 RepID=A0A7K0D5F6_9NOCA|nr:MFS transporter [Nocardia macrotermitis]MQY20967.1 Multidrug resistance protein MdtL [Nocardia macrotermitis]
MTTVPTGSRAADSPGENLTGRLDDASRFRIFSVLAVIVLFTEIAPLQYTMLAASLQKIAPSFADIGANINWSVIVFGLIAAAGAPLIGKIADVWGKKRTFLVCGVLFLIGCLIDATTSSWALFLVGRCLQSLAAGSAVCAYGLVRDLMPRKYVPLSLGVTATGFGFSALIAPILGGWLVDAYQWRAIFWFLAVFTLVMIPLMAFVVPESKLRVRERIDFAGAVLLGAGVALVLIYIDKGQDWGWARPTTLAWLFVGFALLLAFAVVERRVRVPIMDMRLLVHPKVSMVLLLALFASGLVGIVPYAMGYMTQVPSADSLRATIVQGAVDKAHKLTGLNVPASAIGVHLDPEFAYGNGFSLFQYAIHIALLSSLTAMIFGAVTGILARRIGARIPLLVGLVVVTASGITLALMPYSWLAFMLVGGIFGIGFGMFSASNPILITEAVPAEQQGVSTGMLGTAQGMGNAIGLAVITAFLNASPVHAKVSFNGNVMANTLIPDVFGDRGYTLGFVAGTVGAVIALVIVVFMRHGRTPATGGATH